MRLFHRQEAPSPDIGELTEKVYTPDFVEILDKVVADRVSELEKIIKAAPIFNPTYPYAPIVVAQQFELHSKPYITDSGLFHRKYHLVLPYLGKRFLVDGIFYNHYRHGASELELSLGKITDGEGTITIFGNMNKETISIELPNDINRITVSFSQNTYKLSKEDNKE